MWAYLTVTSGPNARRTGGGISSEALDNGFRSGFRVNATACVTIVVVLSAVVLVQTMGAAVEAGGAKWHGN